MASRSRQNRQGFNAAQQRPRLVNRGIVGASSHRPFSLGASTTRSTLPQLENQINETRNFLAVLEKQRIQLRHEENDIHDRVARMSQEIISIIFVHCIRMDIHSHSLLSKESTRYTLSAPLILSAVSAKWRKLAHSMPQLWTNVPIRVGPMNIDSLPTLVREWIIRARGYPLSINIYASVAPSQELMEVLNRCSSQWKELKYEGIPTVLSRFSSTIAGPSKLEALSIRTFLHGTPSKFDLGAFILRPKRLELLCIPSLANVNIDWTGLKEVHIEDRLCVAECLEVLRRAPSLTHCTLSPDYPTLNSPALPQIPLLHISLINLTLIGPYYSDVLAHLLCPSLKSLTISMFGARTPLQPMDDFVKKSMCALTNLFLQDVELVDDDVYWLYSLIALQHLRIESNQPLPYATLFFLLESDSHYYLPALRSLTIRQTHTMNLASLPSIFGSSECYSMARPSLRDVGISFGRYHILDHRSNQAIVWSEDDLRYLLWLREQGVRLKVEARTPYAKFDLI